MDLEATFEQLPVGVAHSDREGHILKFNATFCTLLGYEPEELAGKTFAQITYPGDLTKSGAELERLWRGEIPSYVLEKRYIRKSGEISWIRVTAALVRAPSGVAKSAVGILEDISARRLAEAQLALLHQQTLAASREAGKAEVAADVLHNLGNALNSVNVSASLLAERLMHSPARNLQRAAALVEEHAAELPHFLSTDSRGRELSGYLALLSDHLFEQHRQTVEEFASLRESLQRVIEIVATQQRHIRPRTAAPEGQGASEPVASTREHRGSSDA